MKSAIIFFRNQKADVEEGYISGVLRAFKSGGFDIDTVELLSHTDDLGFSRRINEFKDTMDNLIVVGGDKVKFNLKEIIAKTFDSALVENQNARTFLDAVSKENNVTYPDEYALLPIDGTVIPNIHGGFQGFILDTSDLTLSVLPYEYQEIKSMCDKYVLPYLENKLGINKTRLTLKYFGDKSALENTLDKAEEVANTKLVWTINESFGDITLDLLFDYDTIEQDKKDIVRFIVSNHASEVYAEYDVSLSQRLFDLLKLRGLTLSTAESFTGGRVINEIIKNSGASAFVNEGVVSYSNQSKIKRLNVKQEDLTKSGAVSSIVAYQMAVGLLKEGCDVAISTTGIAGPKSDNTDKPVGLCYIAVGMKDGVHTYRYKFDGTREQITETAKNTALFLAIKKLKSL